MEGEGFDGGGGAAAGHAGLQIGVTVDAEKGDRPVHLAGAGGADEDVVADFEGWLHWATSGSEPACAGG